MIVSERKGAYLRYQGSKKMEFALEKALLRRLAKAWIRWTSLVERLREEEHRVRENDAAIIVQREVRRWITQRYLRCLKLEAQERRRYHAAATITRCIKGKVARIRYERMKVNYVRTRAAGRIIRVGRGMLGRTRANRLYHEKARLKVSTEFGLHQKGITEASFPFVEKYIIETRSPIWLVKVQSPMLRCNTFFIPCQQPQIIHSSKHLMRHPIRRSQPQPRWSSSNPREMNARFGANPLAFTRTCTRLLFTYKNCSGAELGGSSFLPSLRPTKII